MLRYRKVRFVKWNIRHTHTHNVIRKAFEMRTVWFPFFAFCQSIFFLRFWQCLNFSIRPVRFFVFSLASVLRLHIHCIIRLFSARTVNRSTKYLQLCISIEHAFHRIWSDMYDRMIDTWENNTVECCWAVHGNAHYKTYIVRRLTPSVVGECIVDYSLHIVAMIFAFNFQRLQVSSWTIGCYAENKVLFITHTHGHAHAHE